MIPKHKYPPPLVLVFMFPFHFRTNVELQLDVYILDQFYLALNSKNRVPSIEPKMKAIEQNLKGDNEDIRKYLR